MANEAEDIQALKLQVARLTRLVEALYTHEGIPVPNTDVTVDTPPPDVVAAIQGGNLIEAIKLWRGYTDLGLAEAKFEVEQVAANLGR